jgi:hypothetical protein
MKPKRIQIKNSPTELFPENTVIVDFPSRWANPFIPGRMSPTIIEGILVGPWSGYTIITERSAVELYKRLILETDYLRRKGLSLASLRKKNLACWCKIGAPCHADILLNLANE